ncbi:hypothetical protein HHK36_006184 [Tetracentron sinense]|uniref:C2H2-type domain-containing protein n=1 Tax=Tetracentron sinense TaxID=13715 RepID=A0A835DNZ5_TETSI|nr:hypothetical protein HHK36_006184 [Tetracentron sinense]
MDRSVSGKENPRMKKLLIKLCKICKKGFSSGKALGGHMRVHQVREDDTMKKNQNFELNIHPPKLKKTTTNLVDNNTNNPTCSLCGKNFPSMKALFGHMRCHPEREYRGIQPPLIAKTSSSSTNSINRKVDDQIYSSTMTGSSGLNVLPVWCMTAKRGRKSISSCDSKDQIPEGVYDLMMLAHAGSPDPNLSIKRKSEESEAIDRDCLSKKVKIEDGCGYLDGNKDLLSKKQIRDLPENFYFHGIPKTELGLEPVNMDSRWDDTDGLGKDSKHNSEEGSDSKNTDHTIPGNLLTYNSEISTKGKKKIKFKDLEMVGDIGFMNYKQTPITSDRFKCYTCNKSFPSHQALGGHRSSHKKGKNSLPIADIEESAFADASSEEELRKFGVNPTQVDNSSEFDEADPREVNVHQCKICNKAFPTGQALGGHKRCHWMGPVEDPPCLIALPEETSKMGGRMLDFDLNELPVMEDKEVLESAFTKYEQPVDYASSSYNSAT